MLLIDSKIDAAYRRTLIEWVPIWIRRKMREALAVRPDGNSLEHSRRYFGRALQPIADRSKPFVDRLDDRMSKELNLPGFRQWLIATGYTNEYRMIKVFDEWTVYDLERANSG